MQNDFCEGGSLAVPGGAAAAAAISDWVAEHAGDYDLIVATRDWHVDPGPHFAPVDGEPDFQRSWPVHCVAGSHGAQFHKELSLPSGTVVVSKGQESGAYSGFEGADNAGRSLRQILDESRIASVDICGVATSFCDRATAEDALRFGYSVRLLRRLCADVAGVDTEATLTSLSGAGANVVS